MALLKGCPVDFSNYSKRQSSSYEPLGTLEGYCNAKQTFADMQLLAAFQDPQKMAALKEFGENSKEAMKKYG